MSLLKMHFVVIAQALAKSKGWQHDTYVYLLADVMEEFNPLFDRARFIAAADGTPEENTDG